MKNKRILVTGGDGFLGRHLVPKLRQVCKEVCLYAKDVRSINLYKDRFDMVCHLAGVNKVDNDNSLNLLFDVNCNGTLAVMRYCRNTGAKCVFASSAAVYAPGLKKSFLNEGAPANPASLYGVSKLLAENICRSYARSFGVSVTALRIFNMYGPGQKSPFIIPYIIGQLKKNRSVRLKTPNVVRDFTFVQDAARSFVLACAHGPKSFEALNVGTGNGVKVRDLVKMAAHIMKINPKISMGDQKDVKKDYVVADIRKAKKDIGWEPVISLDEGLRLCL